MRSAFLTVGLVLILSVACSSNSVPTAPENPSAGLPSYAINIDGRDYQAGVGDLLRDRVAAAVVPGTDMTPDELRQYFAVNIVYKLFPVWLGGGYWAYCRCYGYWALMESFALETDEEILSWVEDMEAAGYDVPNGPPPDPICDTKPPCLCPCRCGV